VRKIYTPAHIRFLGEIYAGRSLKETARLFNGRFGLAATETAVGTLLARNGLGNNHGRGVPRENRRKYLPRHIQFLKGIVKGRGYAEITRMFNRRFGSAVGAGAVKAVLGRYGLKTGRDVRFKPGNVPFNKGKKGYCAPGSEKGWFKPGGAPFNTMPLGSERVNGGYVEVKYAEKSGPRKNRWKGKHVLVWEKMNGPAPKGHVVVFADGDRRNFKPENLALVSRRELAVLNRMNMLASKNEDVTKIAVGVARLKVLLGDRKRGALETRGGKKPAVIDDRGAVIVIARDQKTGAYFPARKTRFGLRRLRALSVKPRKTMEEAREDLIAYALKRGWRRV
jgi:hypothetical protein